MVMVRVRVMVRVILWLWLGLGLGPGLGICFAVPITGAILPVCSVPGMHPDHSPCTMHPDHGLCTTPGRNPGHGQLTPAMMWQEALAVWE